MPFNEQHPNYISFLTTVAESRAPIVFWIGAGVSADAKLPNWTSLRDRLAGFALEELVTLPSTEADALEERLDIASKDNDLWYSFEILREILGETLYKKTIRDELGASDTILLPELHTEIWNMSATRGVVSLNIDGLEGRAHQLKRPGETASIFLGRDLKSHLHILKDRKPFVARLHGHHADRSSWVFTKPDLSRLLNSDVYTTAIQSIFSNYTVVFMGISAEDTAAGGFLASMTREGLDTGNHFWITDRNDTGTRSWADNAGLLRLTYGVEEGESHTDVICSLLRKTESYASKDGVAAPVVYSGEQNKNIPDQRALRQMDEDEARVALNSHAKYLLDEGGNRTDTVSYQNFLSEFSSAIHQSAHLSTLQGSDKFFGFTAVERIHSGPFSSVWRVKGPDHQSFALKIMHLDNLRKGPQLDSFRRGITSQKLIRDMSDFNGIAKIEHAFEIPPSVIMEYIEGENLEEICTKGSFNFWSDGLKYLINLCADLDKAHNSKFGILHRDVRPTNVMIPNYFYGDAAADHGLDQFAVKILNYDMTWHKDATGRVVPMNPASAGYYAPELITEPDSDRARNTRVDSYGVGMTIFRLSTNRTPPTSGSGSDDWESSLMSIRKVQGKWFKPAHNYLERIIRASTDSTPKTRLSVGDILIKLRALLSILERGSEGAGIEFYAEYLMEKLCSDLYTANASGTVFNRVLDGYRSYQVEADLTNQKIKIFFTNTQNPGADWSKIDKNWSRKLETSKEILASGGWKATGQYNQRNIQLSAEIHFAEVSNRLDQVEDSLSRAISKIQID